VTYVRYNWASTGAIYGMTRAGQLKGSKSPVPGLVTAGSGAVVISGAEAAETLLPGALAGGAVAAQKQT
jgi:hypothetical protein